VTRTVTAALTTEVGKDVTSPGYFVEVGFATPLRLSSRGTMSWSGNTWTTWDVRVRGLSTESGGSTAGGSIVLANGDYTISALVLNEGVANRAVKVWQYYGDSALTASDPVQVFVGVADDATIDPTSGTVTLQLVQTNAAALFAPRFYVTPETGFSFLPAPGTVVDWDGERYVLGSE
jgi:hypothetical protein